ncbi:MAG TPA: hypothetical protein VMS04_15535 [Vicinamibacterales bacterium]|jgi:hypothetical protein|nr:hypothetical protein [Vicinamibacterales bacterium]
MEQARLEGMAAALLNVERLQHDWMRRATHVLESYLMLPDVRECGFSCQRMRRDPRFHQLRKKYYLVRPPTERVWGNVVRWLVFRGYLHSPCRISDKDRVLWQVR